MNGKRILTLSVYVCSGPANLNVSILHDEALDFIALPAALSSIFSNIKAGLYLMALDKHGLQLLAGLQQPETWLHRRMHPWHRVYRPQGEHLCPVLHTNSSALSSHYVL